MRASIITSVLGFTASFASAQYLNESAPFELVVLSSNNTLNGTTLVSCHEGAAIEGLCVGASFTPAAAASSFNFNYSSTETPDPVLGYSGYLTFNLPVGAFNVNEPMRLEYNPTSNVAVPLFYPDESATTVGFDKNDLLFIAGYVDDTVSPAKYESKAYYRWFVCTTNAGYTYETLAWVVGVHSHPQNPTCQSVNVKRVFI